MPKMFRRVINATASIAAGRTGLIQWSVLATAAFALTFIVVQSSVQPEPRVAEAQGLPPNAGWIIFDGEVTVNGQPPDITGFELVARVGDWVSRPVVVGRLPQSPNEFHHLIVNPPHEGHKGQQIEFWVADERANATEYYAVVTELTGEVCFSCPFTFPIRRYVALDFARIPTSSPSDAATGTPSPTPTPSAYLPGSPSDSGWIIFDGEVTVNGRLPDITGFQLVARVGEWESRPVVVGRLPRHPNKFYHLIVNPPHEGHLGREIEFWVADERANITDYYAVISELTGEVCFGCPFTFPIRRSVTLDFARIPAPTPAPTSTNTPTPTNTPTAIPTATPSQTVTPEPTGAPVFNSQSWNTFIRVLLETCRNVQLQARFDWLRTLCAIGVPFLR